MLEAFWTYGPGLAPTNDDTLSARNDLKKLNPERKGAGEDALL